MSRLFEPGRRPVHSWSKLNSIMLSWSETGLRLVADLLAGASKLDDRQNSSSLQVCDQFWTCLRPYSVMEFGLKHT